MDPAKIMEYLKDYTAVKLEILALTMKIASLPVEHDSVTGSLPYRPFTPAQISIHGVNVKTEARLYRRRQRLQRRQAATELFVDAIPDRLIRSILRMRYLEEASWKAIAKAVGGCNTPDSVRMAAKRYFSTLSG